MSRLWTWVIGFTAFALALAALDARAQHAGHGAPAPGAAAPRTFTMEELHRSGGVPSARSVTLRSPHAAR